MLQVRKACRSVALSTLLGLISRAHATNSYTWSGNGPDTNWSTSLNWNPTAVPTNASRSAIFANGQSISANLDTDYSALAPLDQLNLQATAGGSIVFNQTSHTLFIASGLALSCSANAALTYNLSGGTLGVSGSGLVATGSDFNLSGTSALLTANAEQYLTSTFTQTGSSHTYGIMGVVSSTYSLQAGTLAGNALSLSAGTVSQTGGLHTILSVASLGTEGSGGSYLLNGGTFTVGTLVPGPGSTFTQTNGTFNAASLSQGGGNCTFGGPQSIYAIPSYSASGGTSTLGSSTTKTLVTSTLSLSNSAQLDVTTGNVILRDSPPNVAANTLRSALNAGRIYSSALAATDSLAVISAADYMALFGPAATFAGQTLSPGDAMLTHALVGDADLSGRINLSDYALLDAAFLFGHFDGTANVASWIHGDFNNDGKIDFADYALIDNAFSHQSPLANDMIESHSTQFGQPYLNALASLESVPEPATAALVILGLSAMLSRRRK